MLRITTTRMRYFGLEWPFFEVFQLGSCQRHSVWTEGCSPPCIVYWPNRVHDTAPLEPDHYILTNARLGVPKRSSLARGLRETAVYSLIADIRRRWPFHAAYRFSLVESSMTITNGFPGDLKSRSKEPFNVNNGWRNHFAIVDAFFERSC